MSGAPHNRANGTGARFPAARISLFYICIFLVMGVHLPYWPVWFAARGLSADDIGLILALSLGLRVVAGPVIAVSADRLGRRRGPLVALASGCLAGFALYGLTDSFWSILFVTLIANALLSAMMPLIDTLALQRAPLDGFDYGRVRLWGSISFIAASMGGGWFLAQVTGTGAEQIWGMVLVAAALTVGAACLLPGERRSPGIDGQTGVSRRFPSSRHVWSAALGLCRHRQFLLFVLAAAAIQGGHAVYYAFGTLHWRQAGLDDSLIGILWAIGVVAEILLFLVAAPFVARLGPAWCIAIGGVAGILRWSVTAFTPALPVLMLMQCLHAFTFGATHLGAMHFLSRAAPPGLAATAQSIYAALSAGLVIGAVTYLSGVAYQAWGGFAYLGMALLCAAGALAAIRLARVWDGDVLAAQPQSAEAAGNS